MQKKKKLKTHYFKLCQLFSCRENMNFLKARK